LIKEHDCDSVMESSSSVWCGCYSSAVYISTWLVSDALGL